MVILDAHASFTQVERDDVWTYRGPCLGTPDALLAAGPVREVGE
ncbi:hypothetical protein [Streptomyces sp. NPDC006691]